MVTLINEALVEMRIQTPKLEQASSEGSVPYDPQSNGATETGVRLLKGQVRAMQLCLEKTIGMSIPPRHAIMAWVVRHAAHVRSIRMRGTDGLTPYQRSRGAKNKTALAHMGEVVRYKGRAQELHGIAGSGWHWSTGIWLGVDHKTNQYILFDQTFGIRMSRTMMRLPDSQKFFP